VQEDNKALDAVAVVAVALISIFGLGFLLKKSFEDADRTARS